MKYLEYLIWIAGIVAGLLMIFGIIAYFFEARVLGVNHVVNYYHAANSFLLMAICLTLFLKWKEKKQ
jgi:hypothetical protein